MTQNKAIIEDFLFDLYNRLGFTELVLQATIGAFWTKRVRYDYLMSLNPEAWVVGTYIPELGKPMTRTEFLENVNQRSVLDIEVMLDVDDTHHDFIDFTTIKEKAKFIYQSLRNMGYDVKCYSTRSRSYHISYYDPKLRDMTENKRYLAKKQVIEKYFCDTNLAGEHMISLEHARHYKSGNIKTIVRW